MECEHLKLQAALFLNERDSVAVLCQGEWFLVPVGSAVLNESFMMITTRSGIRLAVRKQCSGDSDLDLETGAARKMVEQLNELASNNPKCGGGNESRPQQEFEKLRALSIETHNVIASMEC
jgi:hypothetical protein